jgi:hypothetical protein
MQRETNTDKLVLTAIDLLAPESMKYRAIRCAYRIEQDKVLTYWTITVLLQTAIELLKKAAKDSELPDSTTE